MGRLDGARRSSSASPTTTRSPGVSRRRSTPRAPSSASRRSKPVERRVRPLAESLGSTFVEPCDVQPDDDIARVFERWEQESGRRGHPRPLPRVRQREDLDGRSSTRRATGFALALDVSATRSSRSRGARPLMRPGASILTLTYYGAEKVVANYNVMGVAKAALEACVRYLAADLGPDGDPGQRHLAPARSGRSPRRASRASRRCTARSTTCPAPAEHHDRRRRQGGGVPLCDLARGSPGEVIYVDAGFNVLGVPPPDG